MFSRYAVAYTFECGLRMKTRLQIVKARSKEEAIGKCFTDCEKEGVSTPSNILILRIEEE